MTDVIDYLEFPSSDGAATRKFMAEAFGWTFTSYGDTYQGIDNAGIDAGIDSTPERVVAPLAIVRTNDLPAAFDRVIAAGGQITRDPFDFPGGRRFHFREPGGTELAVWVSSELSG